MEIFEYRNVGQERRLGATIAKAYGVTPKAVRDIWKRRTWADVTSACRTASGNSVATATETPLLVHKRSKNYEPSADSVLFPQSSKKNEENLDSSAGKLNTYGKGQIDPFGLRLDILTQPIPPRTYMSPEYRNLAPIFSMYEESAEVINPVFQWP